MIKQLLQRLMDGNKDVAPPGSLPTMAFKEASDRILTADPIDLILHMEQVWSAFSAPPVDPALPNSGRSALLASGRFAKYAPAPNSQRWDHLGYSYVLENTRAIQIIRRLVREFRSGEGIGIATLETRRWLDATEALLFGAANPFPAWLSTSSARPDSEAGRRNAYWRMFGLDLAFGADDNGPPVYDKAKAANSNFVVLFEELLFELWQAIANIKNSSGTDATDDDRIFRIAEALQFLLRSRRQHGTLAREELAAATALGWVDLTLEVDSPVVVDTGAQATNPANRLANMGARVGLAAHSKSSSLFSMCAELSTLLRTIESGVVLGPDTAWILYRQPEPGKDAIGPASRRVITEWAAATGKDLKTRGKPVEIGRPRLVSVR